MSAAAFERFICTFATAVLITAAAHLVGAGNVVLLLAALAGLAAWERRVPLLRALDDALTRAREEA